MSAKTPEKTTRALELVRDGYTVREAAEDADVAISTVYRAITRKYADLLRKWETNKGTRHAVYQAIRFNVNARLRDALAIVTIEEYPVQWTMDTVIIGLRLHSLNESRFYLEVSSQFMDQVPQSTIAFTMLADDIFRMISESTISGSASAILTDA